MADPAEACIICLSDLEPPASVDASKLAPDGRRSPSLGLTARESVLDQPPSTPDPKGDDKLIAHLLPCGHYLHNACIKPWVERANSCPMCRANFNTVKLVGKIGGPVLSSYGVNDRQQQVEFDPSVIYEEYISDAEPAEPASEDPCVMCESYIEGSGAQQMLICDACEQCCHIFCAGLESVPEGSWFCPRCIDHPNLQAMARQMQRQRQESRRRRALARGRRQTVRRDSGEWESVWESVRTPGTGVDVDFPDDDMFQQRDVEADTQNSHWRARLRIADQQGAGDRFRQTAAGLLRQPTPPPLESIEEVRAWNALDKAREARGSPQSVNRRKRKSPTTSPREPEPERNFKRPRTRRNEANGALADTSGESSSTQMASRPLRRTPPRPLIVTQRPAPAAVGNGPGFLNSLLEDINSSTATTDKRQGSPSDLLPVIEHGSPPMSPGASSAASSNLPSPRANTPPASLARRGSFSPIASTMMPVYPMIPTESPPMSPASPTLHRTRQVPLLGATQDEGATSDPERSTRRNNLAHKHNSTQDSRSMSPPRTRHATPPCQGAGQKSPIQQSSPGGSTLSYSAKTEIQKMVKEVLKPFYQRQEVTKDEFTDVCRDTSRFLYEKVGTADGLASQESRDKWMIVAREEVSGAVAKLLEQRGPLKGKAPAEEKKDDLIAATPGLAPPITNGGNSST